MATTRTLKLNLLADVTKFGQGMASADKDVDKLGKTSTTSGAKMVRAFAAVGVAAGAMAIKIGVDAVQAAAEDEQSQKKSTSGPISCSAPEVQAVEVKAIRLQRRLEEIGYSNYIEI